jgi:hypothetical protein
MRSTAGSTTLLVFGVVLGFIWSGGCSEDNKSQAAPPAQSASGAPLFCYVGSPSANSSVWSLNGGGAGSENSTLMPAPRAGTLKNLHVVSTAAFPSGSVTIVVRKNSADTALLVVYGTADGTNVKSNTTDSVTVAQGDLISIEFRETAGGSPAGILRAGLVYE